MASIPRSIGIEVCKLSIHMNKVHCQDLRNLAKNCKKSQSSFTYVVKQGTIGFDKFSIRQLGRWVGLSGPDITGLDFRSSG